LVASPAGLARKKILPRLSATLMDIGRERQGKPPETGGDAAIRQPNEEPTDGLRQPVAADSVIQQTPR